MSWSVFDSLPLMAVTAPPSLQSPHSMLNESASVFTPCSSVHRLASMLSSFRALSIASTLPERRSSESSTHSNESYSSGNYCLMPSAFNQMGHWDNGQFTWPITSPSIEPLVTLPSHTSMHAHNQPPCRFPFEKTEKVYKDIAKVGSADIVAQIIGKSGQKIKQLISKHNVTIISPQMDKAPVFFIRGSLENVRSAKEELLATAALLSALKDKHNQQTFTKQSKINVDLFVPECVFGNLIGRGGRVLNRLQGMYPVRIAIDRQSVSPCFRLFGIERDIHTLLGAMHDYLLKKCGVVSCKAICRPDRIYLEIKQFDIDNI